MYDACMFKSAWCVHHPREEHLCLLSFIFWLNSIVNFVDNLQWALEQPKDVPKHALNGSIKEAGGSFAKLSGWF